LEKLGFKTPLEEGDDGLERVLTFRENEGIGWERDDDTFNLLSDGSKMTASISCDVYFTGAEH
jgi:hypothetical protein